MTKVHLWLVEERQKAYRFSKLPPERNPEEADFIWLPRSQMEHVTKFAPLENGWRECVLTIPEWLATEKGIA